MLGPFIEIEKWPLEMPASKLLLLAPKIVLFFTCSSNTYFGGADAVYKDHAGPTFLLAMSSKMRDIARIAFWPLLSLFLSF